MSEPRNPDGSMPEDPSSALAFSAPRTETQSVHSAQPDMANRFRQDSRATTAIEGQVLSTQTTPSNERANDLEKTVQPDLERGPIQNRPRRYQSGLLHDYPHSMSRHDDHEHDHEHTHDNDERLELDPLTRQLTRTPTSVRAKDEQGRFVIGWEAGGQDPENPKNWPRRRKMINVTVVSLMALLCPMSSSIMSPGLPNIERDFDTSTIIAALTVSIFVIGFGVGPMILAPLSETFGRRPIYCVCFPIFVLCQIPCALAVNVSMLIVFRLFSGIFGSAGIACGAGTIGDMFGPRERAPVVGKYVLGILLGPAIAPLIGGFTVQGAGWRWTFWIMLIMASVNSVVAILFLRETYAPILLDQRAKQMEKELDHPCIAADHDMRSLRLRLWLAVKRPMKILFLQPIVFIMASYMALIYGTLYAMFTTFPTVFRQTYGFNEGIVGLVYLAPGIGFLLAVTLGVPQIQKNYERLADRQPDKQGKPEFRMPVGYVGAVFVPMGLFWYGWSVEKQNFWLVPLIGAFFFGAGLVLLFQTIQNYFIDGFARYAASAIAAGSIFRAVVGAVFPLWVPYMYDAIGYGWGTSILGFAAVLLMPMPFIIMRYGERLRTRFQVNLDN
ncbi:hypothetical protein PYCC9005_001784 [Savitreella phatthalungensis]